MLDLSPFTRLVKPSNLANLNRSMLPVEYLLQFAVSGCRAVEDERHRVLVRFFYLCDSRGIRGYGLYRDRFAARHVGAKASPAEATPDVNKANKATKDAALARFTEPPLSLD